MARLPWFRLIGEFFVIVFGVLAALAADSWYDARLDRLDGEEYLTRLHSAIADDTATFRAILDWMDRKEAGLSRLEAVLSGGTAPASPDTVLADLTAAANFAWNVGPLVGTATFEDLRSSGRLGLIRDADLRTRIIEYYELAEGEDRRMQARRTQYPHVSYRMVPFERDPTNDVEFAASEDVSALIERLRASELPTLIPAESNRTRFIRASLDGLRQNAADLLESIGSELDDGS